jgi:hypothetical protein
MIHNIVHVLPAFLIVLAIGLVLMGLAVWAAVLAEKHDDWMW